jgi:hypothetical protein
MTEAERKRRQRAGLAERRVPKPEGPVPKPDPDHSDEEIAALKARVAGLEAGDETAMLRAEIAKLKTDLDYERKGRPKTKAQKRRFTHLEAEVVQLRAENARLRYCDIPVTKLDADKRRWFENLDKWAEQLEIPENEFDRFCHAIWSEYLNMLVWEPADAAENLVDLVGWQACLDFHECLGEAIEKADEAECEAKGAEGRAEPE